MNKSIKGNYELISNMKCQHELDISEENYMSEICLYITLICKKCGATFKGIIYKDLQDKLDVENKGLEVK